MSSAMKDWEGQVLNGEFPLCQYLGGSAQSAVFQTESTALGSQKLAIKLIPMAPPQADFAIARLNRVAKLSHPHLQKIHRVGRAQIETKYVIFVLMEYAEENLSEVPPERSLTPAETRAILEPALDVISYLHGQGFVHGHLKPANILAVNDQIRISSDRVSPLNEPAFGLRQLSSYSAPEDTVEKISQASDVWALGMILVETLTQKLPVFDKSKAQEPVVPDTLPEPFREIARHCLLRDPQKRWSLAEISRQLKPPPALPIVQPPEEPEPAPAKPRSMMTWVGVGLALAAVLVVPSLLHRRGEAPPAVEKPAVQALRDSNSQVSETVPTAQNPGTESPNASSSNSPQASVPPEPTPNQPSQGRVPGEVLSQDMPEIPHNSLATIQGKLKIAVKVEVGADGQVVKTVLEGPERSRYFADQALRSARRCKFKPASADGRGVPSHWLLRYEFEKSGVKVFSTPSAP